MTVRFSIEIERPGPLNFETIRYSNELELSNETAASILAPLVRVVSKYNLTADAELVDEAQLALHGRTVGSRVLL